MPSPFPGMDPYIEQPSIWTDFHADLAGEIRALLNRAVQPRYFASLTPYTTYETVDLVLSEAAPAKGIRPDVGVWAVSTTANPTVIGAVTPAPVVSAVPLDLALELLTVEVHRADDMRLVTVLEILSPVNKRPGHEAHADYLRKRAHLLRSDVHLLEIDLLRGGKRMPLERPVPAAPYYVVLSRVERRPLVEVWPVQFDGQLPILPVPLLSPDADVPLDLGGAVESVYERGAYGLRIDYERPAPPPISPDEGSWIDGLLLRAGRRRSIVP